jgi:hypothetical protein
MRNISCRTPQQRDYLEQKGVQGRIMLKTFNKLDLQSVDLGLHRGIVYRNLLVALVIQIHFCLLDVCQDVFTFRLTGVKIAYS